MDGWGFARGFFANQPRLERDRQHPGKCSPVCAIRHQGLGRSLWFRECGNPVAIAGQISTFPASHQGDMWSGVALAAVYAGGVPDGTLDRLSTLGTDHRAALAQGAAFGAEAWSLSGDPPGHAHRAVAQLTGVSLETAAGWARESMAGLRSPAADAAAYQRWRERIRLLAGGV